MKPYTIALNYSVFGDDCPEQETIFSYEKKEDAFAAFCAILKGKINEDMASLFDDMIQNGYCVRYGEGSALTQVWVRNEEVQHSFDRSKIVDFIDEAPADEGDIPE